MNTQIAGRISANQVARTFRLSSFFFLSILFLASLYSPTVVGADEGCFWFGYTGTAFWGDLKDDVFFVYVTPYCEDYKTIFASPDYYSILWDRYRWGRFDAMTDLKDVYNIGSQYLFIHEKGATVISLRGAKLEKGKMFFLVLYFMIESSNSTVTPDLSGPIIPYRPELVNVKLVPPEKISIAPDKINAFSDKLKSQLVSYISIKAGFDGVETWEVSFAKTLDAKTSPGTFEKTFDFRKHVTLYKCLLPERAAYFALVKMTINESTHMACSATVLLEEDGSILQYIDPPDTGVFENRVRAFIDMNIDGIDEVVYDRIDNSVVGYSYVDILKWDGCAYKKVHLIGGTI